RAQQLLKGAVDSALEELSAELWSQGFIHTPKNLAVFESKTPASFGSALPLAPMELITGDATNWFPRKYLSAADSSYDIKTIAQGAEWVPVKDPAGANKIIGRYAYVFADCSGLLDVNLLSTELGARHRKLGTSIGEVDLSLLPDVGQKQSVDAALRSSLSYYHHFDTLPEILYLGFDFIDSTKANNVVPYSLSYDYGWWDWTANQWKQDYDAQDLDITDWNRADAEIAFEKIFTDRTKYDPEQMADAFQDYVDEDFIPGTQGGTDAKVNIVCGEAIPMINEVEAKVTPELLDIGGVTNARLKFELKVELWNPVIKHNNNKAYTCSMVNSAGEPGQWTFLDAIGNIFDPNWDVLPAPVAFSSSPDLRFSSVTFEFFSRPVPLSLMAPPYRVTGFADTLTLEVRQDGVTTVDQVRSIPRMRFVLNVGSGTPFVQRAACNDPRMNHKADDEWVIGLASTWMANNVFYQNFGHSANVDPEGVDCYVRNGKMKSVAEMGYIPGGMEDWTSIDLFSREGRSLLAMFRTKTITQSAGKSFTNGLVNPNTMNPDVIEAVFKGTPIERYPDDPTPPERFGNNASELAEFAAEYVRETELMDSNHGTEYDSAAGWVTSRAMAPRAQGGILSTYGYDNSEKESIIRNSYQLFSPNQNLYTVVLLAQSINDQGIIGSWDPAEDQVTGERKAVALIWRDPFPNEQGRHEWFIRQFKYLEE
ncbi:MAG: hypothetical protein V2A34_14935, partial [Lentisphaerota bacterium]